MGYPYHLDQDPIFGSYTRTNHHRSGCGQSQGAGAGNDKHGNAKEQREQEVVAAYRYPVSRKRPCLACMCSEAFAEGTALLHATEFKDSTATDTA